MDRFSFDDDYVRRLRDGDRETAAHFHSYFRDLLLAKLRRRLRSMTAIDDVRQEVFFRTLERLHTLEDGRKLGAFVNSICNNVLFEHYRADKRAVPLDDAVPVAVTTDPDAAHDSARSDARVRRVLATLTGRDTDILRAVFIEEADKDEVCARYGVDREYLRVLLHRAKNKFREAYLRRKSGRMSVVETFGTRSTLMG